MGKSAKLHKRTVRVASHVIVTDTFFNCYQHKKSKSSHVKGQPQTASITTTGIASTAKTQVDAAKKRATLKDKTRKQLPSTADGVLGGADYVALMMGGRRKAREEAQKLPQTIESPG